MKTSILVLLGFCVVIGTIRCVDAAYAQRKSAQKMAELQDFYDTLDLLQGEENLMADIQGKAKKSKTVYCYGERGCRELLGTGTKSFCCKRKPNGLGGKSYKRTTPGAPCKNC